MRNYLILFGYFLLIASSCKKEEVEPLTANFKWQYLGKGSVSFTAASNRATEYVWDFGDGGIKQSSDDSAFRTYQQNGRYTVRMTARTPDGRSKDVINTITIDDIPTTGQAVIYSTKYDYGKIDVYINGSYEGRISKYFDSGSPACGIEGGVTITRAAGVYTITAKSIIGAGSWSGTVTIVNGQCSKLALQ